MRYSLSKYLTVKTSKACVTETRQAPLKEIGGGGGSGRMKTPAKSANSFDDELLLLCCEIELVLGKKALGRK